MEKRTPKVKEPSMSKDNPDRAARLAQALRENLRRRKAQARAVEPGPTDAENAPPSADDSASPARP
jgi:hypothetical protein